MSNFHLAAGKTVLASGKSGTRAWKWHTLTLRIQVSVTDFSSSSLPLSMVVCWYANSIVQTGRKVWAMFVGLSAD